MEQYVTNDTLPLLQVVVCGFAKCTAGTIKRQNYNKNWCNTANRIIYRFARDLLYLRSQISQKTIKIFSQIPGRGRLM